MPVFLERFVLPILAAIVMGVCMLNPWKWDWNQRISLGLSMIFLAYFFAYTSYQSKSETAKTPAVPAQAPRISGDARTSGDNSPANTGDGNNFQSGQKPKPSPSKPKE
jgi:hypothetical protein